MKQFSPGEWEFISGFAEEKEAIEDTIIRELKEELNVIGVVVKNLPTYELIEELEHKEKVRWTILPFIVEIVGEIEINPTDHIEFRWVNIKQIKEIKDISYFVDIIKSEI